MIKFHHFRNFLIKIFLFNIQSLVIEMFKVINNIAATIIDDLFTTYHSYNLRSKSKFVVPSVRTVHNGQNSIQYYGSVIWNMIVGYIKDSEILGIFKGKIWKWKATNCPCCLCKKNLGNLGFINQIWLSVFTSSLNVKGYFTFLVDATKMYSVLVNSALRCGFRVLLFENFVIFIFCCK